MLDSACTGWRLFLTLTYPTHLSKGWNKELGRDTDGTADRKWAKRPFYTIVFSNQNSGERRCGFVFQDSCCLEPACGRQRVIAFIWLEFFFFLSLKLCSSWLRSFLAFAFPILSVFLLVGRREQLWWYSATGQSQPTTAVNGITILTELHPQI